MDYIFLAAVLMLLIGLGGFFVEGFQSLSYTWYLFPLASLLLWFCFGGKDTFDEEVKAHKDDLLKGGLIKRVDQSIHEEAKRQIAQEQPNAKLPKREYYS